MRGRDANHGNENREVREVIATFEYWNGSRAREVVAVYDNGPERHEIEVAVNDRYVPRYAEIERGDSDE